LAKLCNGVISEPLADAHEELKTVIPQQTQLGSDETSIKNEGKKHWIWCITAASFTLFHIATTRSRAVLEELIGDEFRGHMNCDYFSANCSFAWNFDVKAQYCWTHLIRDIRFLQKHPRKKTKAWADDLLDRSRRLFSAWHRREPTNNHSEQQVRHCVIDRRITQGVRSAVGERYHERMWTAIATCAKQNRSFFEFLHASITARLNAQPSPSLIH
jgi:hypothetical protein